MGQGQKCQSAGTHPAGQIQEGKQRNLVTVVAPTAERPAIVRGQCNVCRTWKAVESGRTVPIAFQCQAVVCVCQGWSKMFLSQTGGLDCVNCSRRRSNWSGLAASLLKMKTVLYERIAKIAPAAERPLGISVNGNVRGAKFRAPRQKTPEVTAVAKRWWSRTVLLVWSGPPLQKGRNKKNIVN